MQASRGWFVTGTDTGVGKTWVSLGLMRCLQQAGHAVLGMKPVASGCSPTAKGLRNEDARRLQAAGTTKVAYEWVNPYAFEPPIAPHLAAREHGITIDLASIKRSFEGLAGQADHVIVEGVGGWEVPLDDHQRVSDLARALELPVILVVGMRLGCLNHALLTVEAIEHRGVPFAGWVANVVDQDMERLQENVAALRERIPAPCLGVVPYQARLDPSAVANALHTQLLACRE